MTFYQWKLKELSAHVDKFSQANREQALVSLSSFKQQIQVLTSVSERGWRSISNAFYISRIREHKERLEQTVKDLDSVLLSHLAESAGRRHSIYVTAPIFNIADMSRLDLEDDYHTVIVVLKRFQTDRDASELLKALSIPCEDVDEKINYPNSELHKLFEKNQTVLQPAPPRSSTSRRNSTVRVIVVKEDSNNDLEAPAQPS